MLLSRLFQEAPVILAGNEAIKKKYLGRMTEEPLIAAYCVTEPGAGSDLAGITTRATRDGDNWIINGAKIWSSGAYYSDYGMCLTRTDWDVPKHRGLTWFAVPCDAPGLRIDPIREINGDEEFCQEFFDDVRVPDADRIGDVDGGWAVTQTMLVFERGAGRATSLAPPSGPGALAPDLVSLARRLGRDRICDEDAATTEIVPVRVQDQRELLGATCEVIEAQSRAYGVEGRQLVGAIADDEHAKRLHHF